MDKSNPILIRHFKLINHFDIFKISSFKVNKEINSDYELKKSFFQAVSNSSRENYGYLVAIEICDRLNEEMERLNKAFLYWNYRIEIKSI